ncbi:MAG: FkbM family methyltransferase [Candidatus Omnitrophica bacterium]|nr:FkbM family methyltransferase [Candidatus Omnitrophota bacterium]
MPKLDKTLSRLIPPGRIRETLKSAYYRFYYNKKHSGKNGFRMYYPDRYYEFVFPNGVRFKCYENIADDLQRSLPGYLFGYDIKKGDTVIDCGAYIGEFTLYAAMAVGETGRVMAFEPDPAFFKKLQDNVSLNGLHNVILIEKGVWSKEDRLKFSGGSQSGNLFAENLSHNTESYDISVTSLDGELEKRGITNVDFIKMDVEGAEIEAVRGASSILEKSGPDLAIASYHILNGQKTCVELEKMLKALGYKTETSHPSHLTTYARK